MYVSTACLIISSLMVEFCNKILALIYFSINKQQIHMIAFVSGTMEDKL